MTLTLDLASAMLAAAGDAATGQDADVSIAVVDVSGRLVAFARMPGAGPLTADISLSKAATAVLLGGDTRDFTAATALATAVAHPLALIPGGVLVRDDGGTVLGAIGVAGAAPDTDDAIARTGTAAGRRRTDV